MAPQKLDGRTDERSGDFILCPMLRIAFDRQKLQQVDRTKRKILRMIERFVEQKSN